MPCYRCTEQKKRDRAGSGDGGVESNRKGKSVIVAEVNGHPRNQRDPKEQVHVRPQNDGVYFLNEMDQVVMVHPVNCNDDEAENISEKGWPHLRERGWGRVVRWLKLQHHDGDEDGHHAITERFQAICSHGGKQ